MTLPHAPRTLLAALAVLTLGTGLAGCGDDGPTTTSADAVPPAMAAQGARGGTATGTAPAPASGSALRDYVTGGRDASASEAGPVRAGFRAFAEAVVARDAEAACTRVVGFEDLLRANGQQGDCRSLLPDVANSAAGPSPRDLELIDEADVVLAGDRATISVGSEAPVPLRRDGGTWKLDYAAFAATPKGR